MDEKFGVRHVVGEDILFGVETAGAEVVGAVVRVTGGKDTAVVVGGRLDGGCLFVYVVDDGEVGVGVDELTTLLLGADAVEDLLTLGGAESVPEAAAGSVAVKELTNRCEEFPKVVIQGCIHDYKNKINNLTKENTPHHPESHCDGYYYIQAIGVV